MNNFEGVYTEDIQTCPDSFHASGLKTRLYYAPSNYFLRIGDDFPLSDYKSLVVIPKGDVEFKGGGWSYFDILIDENQLKNMFSGPLQRKKIKTEVEVFVLGFRSEILGFAELHKNTPFTFAITDANGNNWLIGNLVNRAFLESLDISTGKQYAENSGAAVKIVTNSRAYMYDAPIESVELAGGFSKGFSLGFRS